MKIVWRLATDREQRQLIEVLPNHFGRFLSKRTARLDTEFRVADLGFMEGFCIVQATINSGQTSMFCLYKISGPKSVHILDWTNRPIYNICKHSNIFLKERNVADYLSFFFGVVQGPYGPMTVVEDLQPPDNPADDVKAMVQAVLEMCPPRVVGRTPTMGFMVEAAMLFKDCIFKTRMSVSLNGRIKILDHELALGGLEEDDREKVTSASIR